MTTSPSESLVLEQECLDPKTAAAHLRRRLATTTDPSDLQADLARGIPGLAVVDARSRGSYRRGHVPGALSLPHREMNSASTAGLDRSAVYVVYCDGIGCNASTKGALRLAELGFKVKELLGGMEWWVRDGHPVAVGDGAPGLSSATLGSST
jgi:rhodanese-related sulfurtransferase